MDLIGRRTRWSSRRVTHNPDRPAAPSLWGRSLWVRGGHFVRVAVDEGGKGDSCLARVCGKYEILRIIPVQSFGETVAACDRL